MTGTNVNFTNLPLKIKFWNFKWDLDNEIEASGRFIKILKHRSYRRKNSISRGTLTKRGINEEISILLCLCGPIFTSLC